MQDNKTKQNEPENNIGLVEAILAVKGVSCLSQYPRDRHPFIKPRNIPADAPSVPNTQQRLGGGGRDGVSCHISHCISTTHSQRSATKGPEAALPFPLALAPLPCCLPTPFQVSSLKASPAARPAVTPCNPPAGAVFLPPGFPSQMTVVSMASGLHSPRRGRGLCPPTRPQSWKQQCEARWRPPRNVLRTLKHRAVSPT